MTWTTMMDIQTMMRSITNNIDRLIMAITKVAEAATLVELNIDTIGAAARDSIVKGSITMTAVIARAIMALVVLRQ